VSNSPKLAQIPAVTVDLSTNTALPTAIACANPECEELFVSLSHRQKYHSPDCRKDHYAAKHRTVTYPDLTTGTTGTIGELRVVIDLLEKGYDVFRAASTNCWTDLVVAVSEGFKSVEVKTGHRTPSGKLQYPKPKEKSDVIAVVLPTEIVYLPPLP